MTIQALQRCHWHIGQDALRLPYCALFLDCTGKHSGTEWVPIHQSHRYFQFEGQSQNASKDAKQVRSEGKDLLHRMWGSSAHIAKASSVHVAPWTVIADTPPPSERPVLIPIALSRYRSQDVQTSTGILRQHDAATLGAWKQARWHIILLTIMLRNSHDEIKGIIFITCIMSNNRK